MKYGGWGDFFRCNAPSGLWVVMEHLRYPGLRPELSLFERVALILNIKINFDDPIEPHRGAMGCP